MTRRLISSGKPFSFHKKNQEKAKKAVASYPVGRQASAVKTLLFLAQEQDGWISKEAAEYVAGILDMPFMRVYEVVTFYTLFHLAPVGRVHLQVCTTTPCWLRGADDLFRQCQQRGEKEGPHALTVQEVECLGACANAPVLKKGDDYYENLDESTLNQLMDDWLAEKNPLKETPKKTPTVSSNPSNKPQKPAVKRTPTNA